MRGSTLKRGNRWYIAYDEYDEHGIRKRKQKVAGDTQAEAERKLREVLTGMDVGSYIEPSRRTTAELCDEWLEVLEERIDAGSLAATTARTYRGQVLRRIRPALGSIVLQKLTTRDLSRFYAAMKREGAREGGKGRLSDTTVHQIHVTIRTMLKYAESKGYIGRNVAAAMGNERPKRKKTKGSGRSEAFTYEQWATFREANVGDPWWPVWQLVVMTGLRRGELMGLRWDDVQDRGGRKVLNIERSRVAVSSRESKRKKVIEKAPKTSESIRTIILPEPAVEALRMIELEQKKTRLMLGASFDRSGYIMATPEGQPMHPDTPSKKFADALRRSRLTGLKLHSLRHTCLTWQIDNDVPVKVASENAGHSDVAFTLRTYVHTTDEARNKAADVMTDLLGRIG